MTERTTPESISCKCCHTVVKIYDGRMFRTIEREWRLCDDMRYMCPECVAKRIAKQSRPVDWWISKEQSNDK